MERFLLEGRLVSTRYASGGVTNSLRVTLTDGALTHDAHVQSIDEYWDEFRTTRGTEFAFRDSYRYNIAAYRLARLLGLQNVPVSVERMLRGKTSAVTWWIDDVLMDEKDRLKTRDTGPSSSRFAMQVYIQRVFDELIANTDRNLGNMIWTRDWTMWLIDHTRAFRLQKQLSKPERLTRCDRALLAAIRRLAPDVVKQAVGSSLRDQEIDALVARAGLLVVHFDRLAAERGEARVFFTLTRRRGEAGPAGS